MPEVRLSSHPDREWLFVVAGVERISDGDSYWLYVDTGFRRVSLENFRLYGYDTPELFSSVASDFEKEKAREAKSAAEAWFADNLTRRRVIWLRSRKDPDKYGRWLGEFWTGTPSETESDLGRFLEDQRLAIASPDGGAKWRDRYDVA